MICSARTPARSASGPVCSGHARPLGEQPEFCPTAECRFHDRLLAADHRWSVRHGRFITRARGPIQRFRCTACGKTCSTQTFSIHYRTHATNDLGWLLGYLVTCSGLRQTARIAGVTHRVIHNRCRRLARYALSLMDCALCGLTLAENPAFDGFESFTRSRYHPSNLTPFVGSTSQFIAAAVHTLFRRTGSMKPPHRHVSSHTTGGHHRIGRIRPHRYDNPPAFRLKPGQIVERTVAPTAGRMPRYLMA